MLMVKHKCPHAILSLLIVFNFCLIIFTLNHIYVYPCSWSSGLFFKFDTFVFHILSPFFSRKTFPLKDWKKHAGLGLQLTCQSEA